MLKNHLRKGTCCNWQLPTKVSAANQFARRLNIFNSSAGCPVLQVESNHLQWNPLFDLTALGHGHPKTSEDFQARRVRKAQEDRPSKNWMTCQEKNLATLNSSTRHLLPVATSNNCLNYERHCRNERQSSTSLLAALCCISKAARFQGSPPSELSVIGHLATRGSLMKCNNNEQNCLFCPHMSQDPLGFN